MEETNQTIIMPIHNEQKYLPYSLKPLLSLPSHINIVFVIDRCNDKSEWMVKWFAKQRNHVKIVHKDGRFQTDNPAWDAYLFGSRFEDGFLYWIGADIIVSSNLFDQELLKNFALKFQYIDYPNHLSYAYFKLLSKITKHYCCEVLHWQNLKNYNFPKEELIGVFNKDKYHLQNCPAVIHLRKTKNKPREITQGINRRLLHENPLRVLLHSILFWKPYVLIGYFSGK